MCLDDSLFAFGQMAENGPFVDVEQIRHLLYGQISLRVHIDYLSAVDPGTRYEHVSARFASPTLFSLFEAFLDDLI